MSTIARSPSGSPRRLALAAAVAALALGVTHIVAMRVMYDDAFISYRYAAHLARGAGLVYNPGERVEGYSNFLWTLLMSVVVMLGGRPEDWGPRLSAAIAVATLGFVMWFAHRRGRFGALAGGLLAASSCWATWATGGLETALFGGLVTLGVVALLLALERPPVTDARWLHASAIALGLACLTRPDGPLVAACAAAALCVLAARGRIEWGAVGRWAAVVALFVLPHLMWRWSYYGRWVPNTFAVKPPGLTRLGPGLGYLADAARDLWLWVLAAPIVIAALMRAPPRGLRAADFALIAAVVVPFVGYLAATGGDFMPVFRFVAPLLPLATLAAAAALAGVADLLRQRGLGSGAVGATALVLAAYALPNLAYSWKQQGIWNEGELVSVGWARREVDDWLRIGDLLRKVAAPSDTLATTAAGAIPYRSGLYTLDMLGLNHPDLSKFRRLESNRPGHMILLAERELDEHPPQILLAHPLVHETPATLAVHIDLRPEWHDRVMSHYDLVGLTLLGEPVRYVGCALRHDCVQRIVTAGAAAQESGGQRP